MTVPPSIVLCMLRSVVMVRKSQVFFAITRRSFGASATRLGIPACPATSPSRSSNSSALDSLSNGAGIVCPPPPAIAAFSRGDTSFLRPG